jgi:hypothetical protein
MRLLKTTCWGHLSQVHIHHGIFYLRHQAQTAQVAASLSPKGRQLVVPLGGLPGTRNPATGLPVTSADIYQFLGARRILGVRPITEADLAPLGIQPGSNSSARLYFVESANYRSAYAQQASFEIERAVGKFAASVAYNFNRAAHLPRIRDLLGGNDATGAQQITYESAANSFYHALVAQVTRRYGDKLLLNASYTFGKSIDETTDFNFLPNDSFNPRADRARSSFDQRHRLVASAVVQAPRGVILAPIVNASSGRPFNVVTGIDINSRRPAGAGRNIGLGPSYFSADLRASKRIAFGERWSVEAIAEGFNLLNRTNFRRINNTVGEATVNDLPRPLVGVRGDALDPFSFVSAFDPRQFQFALKLHF